MGKILIIAIIIGAGFIACKNNSSHERKKYKPNTFINRHNACNTLFTDSAAIENFINRQKLNDETADQIRDFYYQRNFEFAWFSRYMVTEQGREFWNLANFEMTSRKDSVAHIKILSTRMPNIMAEDTVWASARDTFFVNTELMLTDAFIQYLTKHNGQATTGQLTFYLPALKQDMMEAAAAITDNKIEPAGLNNDSKHAFGQLKNILKLYYTAAKNGGWQTIPYTGKKITNGIWEPVITLIKNRLRFTGEYTGNNTSPQYDTDFFAAVQRVQAEFGYKPDGIITDSLLKDLNVPAKKRVQQILINLNRLMWMPETLEGRLITANIPEFALHVCEDKKKVFDMDVVVGKQSSATVIFSGNLTEIVFSPYWNIPPSIIKKEILPKMQDDSGYLSRQNLEIKGYKNGLPVVRQLPGPNNSLGRVKFLFNNSYNIYFHDTPAKDLFSRRKRAYSHGCIRLSDPVKMASYLLNDTKEWTTEKIKTAMASPTEVYAPLKHGVPVLITYYTAWASDNGNLNLRDDLYGHDEETANKLYTNKQ